MGESGSGLAGFGENVGGEATFDFAEGNSDRGLRIGAAAEYGGGEDDGLLVDETKHGFRGCNSGDDFVVGEVASCIFNGLGVGTLEGVTVSSPRSRCPRDAERERGAVWPKMGSSGSLRGHRE